MEQIFWLGHSTALVASRVCAGDRSWESQAWWLRLRGSSQEESWSLGRDLGGIWTGVEPPTHWSDTLLLGTGRAVAQVDPLSTLAGSITSRGGGQARFPLI